MTQHMTAAQYRAQKRRKPRDIEGPIHRAILHYLRDRYPDAVVHHSPNSIGRSGVSIARQIEANREMGAIKGFPDLACLMPGGATWLFEVKAPRNYPDRDQRALHDHLRSLGFCVAVVRSIEDVEAVIAEWTVASAGQASIPETESRAAAGS